jgi:hypothetical protein
LYKGSGEEVSGFAEYPMIFDEKYIYGAQHKDKTDSTYRGIPKNATSSHLLSSLVLHMLAFPV